MGFIWTSTGDNYSRAGGAMPLIFLGCICQKEPIKECLQMGRGKGIAVLNRLTVTCWFSDLIAHFHELLVYT